MTAPGPRRPQSPDPGSAFAALRGCLALISIEDGMPELAAATQGFSDALGLGPEALDQPLLPLLPEAWRPAIERAIQACAGARRSKRVKGLHRPGDGTPCDVEVYRAAGEGLEGYLVLVLENRHTADWFADPRVVSLFPQLRTNSAALVYESDVRARRSRYSDNGLIALLGLPRGVQTFDEMRNTTHPDDRTQVDRFWAARASLADNEINSLTVRMRAVSGQWRMVTIRARVLRRDPSGRPRRMLGVAMDVTDHNALAVALSDADVAAARAGDEERLKIRGELHNSTAQHLLAISLAVHNLERMITRTATVDELLDDIRTSIGAAQREIQTFSFMLHPQEISDVGLFDALEAFCTGFARRTGLSVEFEAVGDPTTVSVEIEATLYKVAQDASMHAFRQAGVTGVQVRLRWRPDTVALELIYCCVPSAREVEAAVLAQDDAALQAMRTRLARVDGTLDVRVEDGWVTLLAEAPLAGRAIDPGAP